MAYNKFTIAKIRKQFELGIIEAPCLFADIVPIAPSPMLRHFLQRHIPLAEAIGTEKAKSEFIVAPLLAEVRELHAQQVSLFSGVEFNVDEQQGLSGRCDYIISQSALQFSLSAPVLMMVEAKNDNLNAGLGQCMAEMVAGQLFNQREGNPLKTIFGGVTTGSVWRFLTLTDQQITIDQTQYFISDLDNLLGILVHVTRPTSQITLPS